MTGPWEPAQLLAPLSESQPCGVDLEDTDLLASFDTFRLFGESRPLDAPADQNEKRVPKPRESPEWVVIRDKAVEALGRSKDLRLLAVLATALLRTDGIPAFAGTLTVAAGWLETYWDATYPRVDGSPGSATVDAMLRRNALNCLADPMAVIEAIRRTPLVTSRQHGLVTLRDIELAGAPTPRPDGGEPLVEDSQVRAAFASMPFDDLTRLQQSIVDGVAALRAIEVKMRDGAGTEATPSFDRLLAQLQRLLQVLKAQMASHPGNASSAKVTVAAGGPEITGTAAAPALGPIGSRQDAIRALDAVADFFRRTEPSSPVPMFLARAKRLVAKDFLEVLADIAPEAVPQARAAGGLREGE